ncbi:MAG: aryl-sulfate sulfotransferase [Planctomycetes bacterium]|nr:aryl-sulfate sulfotransferase [Planctomycetota bacterium]
MHHRSVLFASIVTLALASCHRSSRTPGIGVGAPKFVGDVEIAQNNNAWVPQVAVVSLETDVPTRVELRISDGQSTWEVTADPDYATAHPRVPVVGMRAGRSHTIEVTVRDVDGQATAAPVALTFTTPDLPVGFPMIDVEVSLPQYMEDGLRLLSILTNNLGSVPTIIDANGEVLWYFDASQTPLLDDQVMVFPMQNGNLMLIGAWRVMVEINLLGDVLNLYYASRQTGPAPGTIAVDTDSFHHEFLEMPAGSGADFAVLGTERRTYTDYPTDVVDPNQTEPSADVIGDEILELNRDGTVVRRFRLLDLLDPYRMTYDTLGNFWDEVYLSPTKDWSHANGLALDERNDRWIVSLRHQDAVVAIDRASGQVAWIAGDPARWNPPWSTLLLSPIGAGFEWQYHQHAPQLLSDGTLMLFDNGNGRAVPPTPALPFAEAYSRALQLRIDAGNRTVEQVWSYGGPPGGSEPSFYSFFVSSAFRQPATGNVIVCDGGKLATGGRMYGRVFEVTSEPTPQVVFACEIGGDGVSNNESYFVYRAYRLPGF